MPIYNASLQKIDPKETRRYAGLQRAENFSETLIESACEDAMLLARPQGIWHIYEYDNLTQTIKAETEVTLKGEKIGTHLHRCEKVVILAATVGETIEEEVTRRFQEGEYTSSLLLDAAATTAVEQVADAMEKVIYPIIKKEGFSMVWRFSPGYGDWPIEQQPEMMQLAKADKIGMKLSSSLMLMPRKSITAIIGLFHKTPEEKAKGHVHDCKNCTQLNCPARKI